MGMKFHWRAFFELTELSAESLRQVAIMPQDANTIRLMQDSSKLGTTMGWKWFSRLCEGQHQVEPDPSVHNLPSRRLHHWSPCHVTSKHTKPRRSRPSCSPPYRQGRPAHGPEIGHGTEGNTAPHR